MSYTYMAMIQQDAGDYFGVQESGLEGLKHVNEKDPRYNYCLSSIYNELGVSSAGLKNYDAALDYYDQAIKFQQDEAYKMIFQNNKAVTYREKKEYAKAIEILQSLLAKQLNDRSSYARILTNLASLKWIADSNYNPLPELRSGLAIRIKEQNKIDITASYKHLSDYYLPNNPDSALFYTKKMYGLALKTNSVDEKLDALQKLATLTSTAEAKEYFRQYYRLSDSNLTARNAAKNQFALIRYHSEKNKADNLRLQQENAEGQFQIFRQRIIIYGIAALATATLLIVIQWWRKKKQRLELESKVAAREHQLKTSQKVHDVVANGLYRIIVEIEHNGLPDKESLLDRIDALYERSRDIFYEPADDEYSAERINEMLSSFGTPKTKVSIVGDLEKIWDGLPPEVSGELAAVLQELMVNMSKHSKADNVVVHFELKDSRLIVNYHDDGIGLPADLKYGNGLKSTGTRIRKIKGELIFTTENNPGASIRIIIPIPNV